MCHQSVGLIQSVIEAAGIPTASVSLLAEVTVKVKPPRVLLAPFPMGYPLGRPSEPALQRAVLKRMLDLLERPAPRLEEFITEAPL